MGNGRLGVGIIGVQPGRSWAEVAHVPALQALPKFEIALKQSEFFNVETGEQKIKTSSDQAAFTGASASGDTIARHYCAAVSRGTNRLCEINGTEGDIQVIAIGGHIQMFDFAVSGAHGDAQAVQPILLPDGLRTAPAEREGPALNVAQARQSLEQDIRTGSRTCPDIEHAVQPHKMVAAIEVSTVTGFRETV